MISILNIVVFWLLAARLSGFFLLAPGVLDLQVPKLVRVALIVGTIVSLLQTVTSIQEQTLSFVPKLLACAFCLWLMAPWMLQQLGALFELLLGRAGMFMP